MTDDTDTAEREDELPAASLALIETFAALEAELAAKEDRIERLESELGREYLEPSDADAGPTETEAEPATATDQTGQERSRASDKRQLPRSTSSTISVTTGPIGGCWNTNWRSRRGQRYGSGYYRTE